MTATVRMRNQQQSQKLLLRLLHQLNLLQRRKKVHLMIATAKMRSLQPRKLLQSQRLRLLPKKEESSSDDSSDEDEKPAAKVATPAKAAPKAAAKKEESSSEEDR